jgi:hypothetical protein
MTEPTMPILLHQPDYAKRAESEIALQDEMLNDELALRLGRAFLRGRVDQFLNVTIHLEMGAPPPFPTQEECDMYATGYQYSFDSNMHEELADSDELDAARLGRAIQIKERLDEISVNVAATGLTLELLNERVELRYEITTMTLDNILRKLHNSDPVEVTLRKAVRMFDQRRPYATGRTDASED